MLELRQPRFGVRRDVKNSLYCFSAASALPRFAVPTLNLGDASQKVKSFGFFFSTFLMLNATRNCGERCRGAF